MSTGIFLFKYFLCFPYQNYKEGTYLVAQWLRIRLPVQETQVQALVREDPTCCGATKPVHHSYWACALDPASHNYWARVPQLLKPARLEPMLCSKEATANKLTKKKKKTIGSLALLLNIDMKQLP